MDAQEEIEIDKVEDKFSVLYLSLRTRGVQKYLHLDVQATPDAAKEPVPKEHIDNLVKFSLWLFGDKKRPPLLSDSRMIDDFGKILESNEAVEYLERTDEPRFEMAYRKAGVGEAEVIDLIEQASDNIQLALTEVHVYKKSERVQKSVKRLGNDALALLHVFPSLKDKLLKEESNDAEAS